MKRWCCVMDCNCTELLKRGMADDTLSNHQNISFSSSLPTFSSFFSDFQTNLSKLSGNSGGDNPMQSSSSSLLPDTSHTSLLYTTFIRSFSSCTHQVMVMESENTCITFLPILDPEDVANNHHHGTTNSSKFTMYHTPPSMSMLLIVADVLNSEEKSDGLTRKKSNVIFQHFCNETYLKILESIIYLFISKTTLSSITAKQSSDKVAKKIPQVKITLNSMTDIITYLLQSSTPYSIKKSFDFENDLKETPSLNSYLQQPFEQLCLRPGRKTFKFPEVKDNEISFQKLMTSLHSTFKNGIFCSAIYINSGYYYTGLDWHKILNQQQMTAISVYMNSLAHSQNDCTTRDIPIIVRENVATRLISIKLIDNIQYCAIVYGDTKASDISTVIQFKGDEWAKAVIRLSNIMTKSILSLIYDISEKNEVLSEVTHLMKVKAMLLLNNSGSFPYYLYENFVNCDTDTVLYEKIEHTLREFYINSMMTVFDIFQPQGDEFNVDINETYVITKELAISAFKKNQSVLFCVFDSTCPRYEFSVITQEILNLLTRKNLL